MSYSRHPLSAAWPNMSAEEFAALTESIQLHGLREPIVLMDGMVLDGWHRYQACVEAGMEPAFSEFDGDDAREFVSDKHNRRSLTLTQRMTAIALMNKWAPSGAAGHKSKVEPGSTLTHADLAKQAGGSTKTAQQVKVAISKGTKAVVAGMQDGTLSAKRAAEIAQLPAKEQAKAIKAPKPPKVEPEEVEYFGPSQEEMDAAVEEAKQDVEMLQRLLESDDKLAALAAENSQLRAELAVVKVSRDGYMNRSNELIDRVKWLKRKLAKAEAANV